MFFREKTLNRFKFPRTPTMFLFRRAAMAEHIVSVGQGGERFAPSNLQSLCWSCRSRKSTQEGLREWGKEKRGTITSPRCLCVTEPKPLILRKRFHPTPTSKKRKIILVEYKKEKFRLISALQALRVRRCVCFRR